MKCGDNPNEPKIAHPAPNPPHIPQMIKNIKAFSLKNHIKLLFILYKFCS